ncbi:ABC transporter permease [Pradoshia eiseniae]|uniref:ABC transporter permease n=1 Tax=Pradoshia eiseniae TaxID=2064768 RepID=A0A2S7N5B5_9BACI|nr:FtsX-like permease family protein [Pradoshia eiseniae]PQD97165.1 ABC transporter permease [Pradoshia eiseniae]
MIRFIWNNWWRNKGRFLLLLAGALIVSTGLSYLVGVSQTNNGTIVKELQNRWKSSYHIVVRPPEARSVTEDLNLLEPNYQSGLSGGISLVQYKKIKEIQDIEIAAPIAMLGFISNSVQLEKLSFKEQGIYRLEITEKANSGADVETYSNSDYWSNGIWQPKSGLGTEYGVYPVYENFTIGHGSYVMLAGIDPEAEAALVGLDESIIENKNSRYFTNEDTPSFYDDGEFTQHQIPILLSNQEYTDSTMTYTLSKVDIPYPSDQQVSIMESIKDKGGKAYLDKQETTVVKLYEFTTKETHKKLLNAIMNPTSEAIYDSQNIIAFKSSDVEYEPVTSPFKEQWPYAYEVKPYIIPENLGLKEKIAYRSVNMFNEDSLKWPRVTLDVKGVYDPSKLKLSKDPLTELPMETYFPAKAKWVLDKNGNPVNPSSDMIPLDNPYGFLTKPPSMLTTIEAAAGILGEKPISSIRIKVHDVEKMDDASAELLKKVAKQIEDETGLITDITLGSSPQPALTYIPGTKTKDSLGWIEQPWIKLGSSVSIFQEAKIGLSGVIASVILVAIVYVFSSNLVMMYTRRKEFAVLLSIGWRPGQLSRLLFMEATLLGIFVSLTSWLILGYIYLTSEISPSLFRFILIGLFGLMIYWLGTIIPALLVRKIKPYETMKSGEVSSVGKRWIPSRSIWTMSLHYLVGKWKRSLLSIISISLPTALFIVFLFVTFRLKGVMYATWLGQYVAVEVSSLHYIAMGVALLISILTTTEIIWQNVSERQPEIAILKSVGWYNQSIYWLVILEGVFSGFFAGIIGIALAIFFVWELYGIFPAEQLVFFLLAIFIPILTGMLGAVFPASKAMKIQPYQGMSGTAEYSRKTEKQMKIALFGISALLFIGLIGLLANAIPEMKESNAVPVNTNQVMTTEGETTKKADITVNHTIPNEKSGDIPASLQSFYDEAWKTVQLGETIKNSPIQSFKRSEVSIKEIPANHMEYISITMDVKNEEDAEGGNLNIKPVGFKMVDGDGKEYMPIDIEIPKKKHWNGYQLAPGGHVQFKLTFEVPNSKKPMVLIYLSSYEVGPVLVEI